MRLPNNYGAILKLNGNRRKPWAVRINIPGGKPKYIGFTATKEEALQMLAEYHRDPIDLEKKSMTFEEVYKLASEEHFPTVKANTVRNLRSSFKSMEIFHHRKFADLRLADYQPYFDTYENSSGTASVILRLLSMMYKYAMRYEIVSKNYASLISLAKIREREEKQKSEPIHKRYTPAEVEELWNNSEDFWAQTQLIMIYTGMRISEFYHTFKYGWVDYENKLIDIKEAKSKSGIRKIPISGKIIGFFTRQEEYCKSIVSYQAYDLAYSTNVKPHLSHDCRYTFVSMLSDMLVDERIINELVGHAQSGLTNSVYMNMDFQVLRDTIDRL